MSDASGITARVFAVAAIALAAGGGLSCTQQASAPPPLVHLGIDESGAMKWNGEPITTDQLKAHLAEAVKMRPKPDVSVEPMLKSPYAKSSEIFEILGHYDIRAVIIGGT